MMENVMNGKIMAIVVAVVIVVIAFLLAPMINGAINAVGLQFDDHCRAGGTYFTQVSDDAAWAGGSNLVGVTKTASAATCDLAATTTALDARDWFAPDGTRAFNSATAVTVTAVAGTAWHKSLQVLQQYGGITRMVVNLMPLLVVVAMIGFTALLWKAKGSSGAATGSIQAGIAYAVGSLIVLMIAFFLLPTIFEQINGFYLSLDSTRYQVMSQFGSIMKLVVGFFPLLTIVGAVSGVGFLGSMAVNMFRGSGQTA